ncbi:MAG: hypothetical protein HY699_13810 [Deltaproteobacteria bacterium]|nr:hypothetical protein [Deltaproteobacteria bacterium]
MGRQRLSAVGLALVTVMALARPQTVVAALLDGLFAKPSWTVVTQRSRTGLLAAGHPLETVTTYLTDDHVIQDRPARRTIVDLRKQTITFIDKENLAYGVAGFAELRQALAAADARRDQDTTYQRLAAPSRAFQPQLTDETANIAGQRARKYRVMRGAATTDIWMSSDLDVPAAVKQWADMDTVLAPSGSAVMAELSKLDGLPLKTESWVLLGEQKQGLLVEASEIRQAGPPASMINVPAGYRTVDWRQLVWPGRAGVRP